MNGKFITFEGVEGCGKTTLIESFGKYLREEEKEDIAITKEPGEGNFGREIREILKYKDYNLSPTTQLYLFLADRQHHIEKFIIPYLDMNYIILCDRYVESTIAYQGFGSELINSEIFDFGYLTTTLNFLTPNLTIFLDIDCDIGLKRKGNENDNFEKLDIDYHNRVRNGYLELMNIYNKSDEELTPLKLIDASQYKNEVLNEMKGIWKEFINE